MQHPDRKDLAREDLVERRAQRWDAAPARLCPTCLLYLAGLLSKVPIMTHQNDFLVRLYLREDSSDMPLPVLVAL